MFEGRQISFTDRNSDVPKSYRIVDIGHIPLFFKVANATVARLNIEINVSFWNADKSHGNDFCKAK